MRSPKRGGHDRNEERGKEGVRVEHTIHADKRGRKARKSKIGEGSNLDGKAKKLSGGPGQKVISEKRVTNA